MWRDYVLIGVDDSVFEQRPVEVRGGGHGCQRWHSCGKCELSQTVGDGCEETPKEPIYDSIEQGCDGNFPDVKCCLRYTLVFVH